MATYGLVAERPLPDRVEVSVLPGAFLLESPEPLHLDRVAISAFWHRSPPLRFTTIVFDDERFAPDVGTFSWGHDGSGRLRASSAWIEGSCSPAWQPPP